MVIVDDHLTLLILAGCYMSQTSATTSPPRRFGDVSKPERVDDGTRATRNDKRPLQDVRRERRTTPDQHFYAGQPVSEGGLELRLVMCYGVLCSSYKSWSQGLFVPAS